MVYGYIRVSTNKQDGTNQRKAITDFMQARGFEECPVMIEEVISGTKPWEKRKLGRILKKMEKGDTIIVSEISRLGRSMLELMEILSMVMKKGVHLYAIKGNYELADNIQSKVLAFAFSLAGEIERELISARTKEALARKKAEGVILGHRKGVPFGKKLTGMEFGIRTLLEQQVPMDYIAREMGVSRMTLSRFMKENGMRPMRGSAKLDFFNLNFQEEIIETENL